MSVASNLFPSQVVIAKKNTANVGLAAVNSYTVATSSIPALVQDASANLQLIYGQRNIVVDHVIYFSQPNVTFSTGDIIQFGSRLMMIRAVLDKSGLNRVFEVHATEMKPGQVVIEKV